MPAWTLENAAHLLRRAAFGGTPEEVQAFYDGYGSVEEAVADILGFRVSGKKPPGPNNTRYDQLVKMRTWWIKAMAAARTPAEAAREKLTLFWHNHLVSGASKQPAYKHMAAQNRLLRRFARGNFRDLVREFNRDPANLYYLDGITNVASLDGVHAAPNENWGRELLELFTLGRSQLAADGSFDPLKPNYTEDDVHQMARASTGWTSIKASQGVFDIEHWDGGQYDDDGDDVADDVTLFGVTNNNFRFDDAVVGTPDDVLSLVFARADYGGNNQVGLFLARKLWTWYAYPPPAATLETNGARSLYDLLAELAAVFAGNDFETTPLLQAMWSHDEFYSDRARRRTVKTPIDYIVGSLRALGISRSDGKTLGDSGELLAEQAEEMGMALFEPPNVAGWPGGESWMNSGTLVARLDFARQLAASRSGRNRLRLDAIEGLAPLLGSASVPASDVIDAILHQLGLDAGPVALTSPQKAVLESYAGATLDLSNEDTSDARVKVRGLISLALQCAEYQIF